MTDTEEIIKAAREVVKLSSMGVTLANDHSYVSNDKLQRLFNAVIYLKRLLPLEIPPCPALRSR